MRNATGRGQSNSNWRQTSHVGAITAPRSIYKSHFTITKEHNKRGTKLGLVPLACLEMGLGSHGLRVTSLPSDVIRVKMLIRARVKDSM